MCKLTFWHSQQIILTLVNLYYALVPNNGWPDRLGTPWYSFGVPGTVKILMYFHLYSFDP
jgi:hypothetical protein